MPEPPPLHFDIALEFPGEYRISEYHPTKLNAAIEYALDFARRNRGVRVRVSVNVPVSAVHDHCYTFFECQFPALEPFMESNIRKHFGHVPE